MPNLVLNLREQHNAIIEAHDVTNEVSRIMYGFRKFQANIARELELLERTFSSLTQLPQASQLFQLAELQASRQELTGMSAAAGKIVDWLMPKVRDGTVDRQVISKAWSRIGNLLNRERQRRFHDLRVQGGLVERTEPIVGADCHGQHGEAVIRLIDVLNRFAADPTSKLQGLWRFWTNDDSIWLYHHEPERKWECMFFRIEVTRLGDAVDFVLESYVPVGFGNDPTPYKLDKSEVYIRHDWTAVESYAATFNSTNTMNLNVSNSTAFGKSLGRAVSTTVSTTDTKGINSSTGESLGESTGTTQSTGWSESLSTSSSRGYSNTWQSGGVGLGSDSSTRSRTETTGDQMGRTGGTAKIDSNSYTKVANDGTMESTTEQNGSTDTDTDTETITETLSKSTGYSAATGESLQVSMMAWGVDHSVSAKEKLELWKQTNSSASAIYDRVQSGFRSAVNKVIRELANNVTGSTVADTRGIHERYGELKTRILCEDQFLSDRRSDQSLAALVTGRGVRSLKQASGHVLTDATKARALASEPITVETPPEFIQAPRRISQGGN